MSYKAFSDLDCLQYPAEWNLLVRMTDMTVYPTSVVGIDIKSAFVSLKGDDYNQNNMSKQVCKT